MRQKNTDTVFYILGWCAVAVIILYGIVHQMTGFQIEKYLPPCVFHELTGFYCPGCGGTRAVLALAQGRIVSSFVYHPFVLYAAVLGTWFMISQSIERLAKKKLRFTMHYHDRYLWIALGILAANFLIKNILLIL